MRVRIDPQRCGSTGYCQRIAPTMFDLDADGVARVIGHPLTPAACDAVREAASVCPTRAIIIEE